MAKKKVRSLDKSSSPLVKIEDFKPSDQLLEFPALVLGIEARFDEWARDFKFSSARRWLKISHQAAGMACNQYRLYCTVLCPNSARIEANMRNLSEKWFASNLGCFGVSLNEIIQYRNDIRSFFNADCNVSYRSLQEGLYPIDVKFAGQLTNDKLPEDLDDLIQWDSGWSRSIGSIGRFGLYILGNNSD